MSLYFISCFNDLSTSISSTCYTSALNFQLVLDGFVSILGLHSKWGLDFPDALAALGMNFPIVLAHGTFQAPFLLPSLFISPFLCSLDYSSLLSMSEGMPWGMFLLFPILPQLPPEGIGWLWWLGVESIPCNCFQSSSKWTFQLFSPHIFCTPSAMHKEGFLHPFSLC